MAGIRRSVPNSYRVPDMSLTLRQIRYFLAVAETGKISEAAADINVSPSAVTEAIKELENHLGTRLFVRGRSGVKLTYEGYRFLQHGKNILSAVANAEFALSKKTTSFSGRLDVGATITVSGYFMPRLISRFRKTFPNVDIRLHEHSRTVIERKIEKGQIDIGVVLVSNVTGSPHIEALTLFRSQRRLWISANHPFNACDQVSLAEVAKEPYIQLLIDEAEKTTVSYWQRHGFRPRVLFRTESVEAVRSMIAAGAGVTVLSDLVHRPWSLEGDRIETRPIVEYIPTMDTGLIWNVERPLSQSARSFIDFCRMEYTSGQPNLG